MLRPLTTRVPAFGLLAEWEGDSNFEALRLQKRLRFLTEVPIRIRQVRHINGSLLFRVSRLVLGSRQVLTGRCLRCEALRRLLHVRYE